MMPLPRPLSVRTVTTLGWARLTMSTTGANGSTAPAAGLDVVGDATAPATGASLEPGSTAFWVVPCVAALGGGVALETWTQPLTAAATRARAARNWESRSRVM